MRGLVALIIIVAGAGVGYLSIQQSEKIAAVQAAKTKAEQQEKARLAEIERKKKEPVYVALMNAQPIKAIAEDPSDPNSLWAMINKMTKPLPDGFTPKGLAEPNVPARMDKSEEERSVRKDVVEPLERMFKDAKAAGHNLMVGSAFRSPQLQQKYYDNYVVTSGVEAADQYSAKPGSSEHQLGLSVDISTESRECYLSECFTALPDGEWLAANAYKYGFTLRYKKGKEVITGYNFEPWHYRYVGVDLATALQQSNLTMEEAWPTLQEAADTLKKNGAL